MQIQIKPSFDRPLIADKLPEVTNLLSQLRVAIQQELVPKIQDIDVKGEYPREFMHKVGALGGFAQAVCTELGGTNQGIKSAIQVIEEISKECVCTGFITWCQIACAGYLQNSENLNLKHSLLPKVATGQVLVGTGLSNPMKHFAGIEKIALVAERRPDGYVINGLLPWVSNIGTDQYFAVAAKIQDTDEYLMAIVSDNFAGLSLKPCASFIALEGSGTYRCFFKDVFVPNEFILAVPCEDFVSRIKPGFILTQVGMGLGLVDSCVELMKRANQRTAHVNCVLDDGIEAIETDLLVARQKTYILAEEVEQARGEVHFSLLRDIIQARIVCSELSLRASNAAMLYAGARAYLRHNAVERKLRESYFIAIVTPALKHLKKILHEMSYFSGGVGSRE